MCFDEDSRPPIPPIAGGSIDGTPVEFGSAEGARFAAYRADAAEPTGAGILVLPDVRGLHPYYEELALRFAEAGVDAIAIDYYGRTAGVGRRDSSFEFASHNARTTWAGIQADALTAALHLRRERGVRSLFSVGFCFGGRVSFLLATVAPIELSGAIGFYGWPVGPSRNDTPAPADVAASMHAPILGLFGGDDPGIPPESVAAFRSALESAGVEHRVVVYPGAPHSFFDRKHESFADASAQAWAEVRAFIRERTGTTDVV